MKPTPDLFFQRAMSQLVKGDLEACRNDADKALELDVWLFVHWLAAFLSHGIFRSWSFSLSSSKVRRSSFGLYASDRRQRTVRLVTLSTTAIPFKTKINWQKLIWNKLSVGAFLLKIHTCANLPPLQLWKVPSVVLSCPKDSHQSFTFLPFEIEMIFQRLNKSFRPLSNLFKFRLLLPKPLTLVVNCTLFFWANVESFGN